MKLLICEDDISTIEVIENQIDLSELGFSEVFQAYNGQMGIDIIEKEKPEVVLCDIGMPILRGDEVLKYIHDHQIETQFIFLTCYEDFKYAQIAIQYGASDYITKPFEIEDLRNLLQKQMAKAERKILQKKEEQSEKDMLMCSAFRRASYGLFGNESASVEESLKKVGIDISLESRWRIVFSCSDITDVINKTWKRDLIIFTNARLHNEAINHYIGLAYAIVDMDDRFVWTICFVPEALDDDELYQRSEQLIKFCNEHLSQNPVVFISNEFAFSKTAEVVAELFGKIRKARAYAGKIFFEHDDFEANQNIDTSFNENQVLWHIKKQDREGYEEYMRTIIDRTNGSKDTLDKLKTQLMTILVTNLNDNGISGNVLFLNENLARLDKKASFSKNDFFAFAKEVMAEHMKVLQSMKDNEGNIERAKRYIDENFRENFDRDEVAAISYVTPNYFSKLFRNTMGMNLREYINRLRIDEAKRLLLSTSMSVSEIASYVGYYNISYFSTVFHKLVGESPIDWRNNNHQEEQDETSTTIK